MCEPNQRQSGVTIVANPVSVEAAVCRASCVVCVLWVWRLSGPKAQNARFKSLAVIIPQPPLCPPSLTTAHTHHTNTACQGLQDKHEQQHQPFLRREQQHASSHDCSALACPLPACRPTHRRHPLPHRQPAHGHAATRGHPAPSRAREPRVGALRRRRRCGRRRGREGGRGNGRAGLHVPARHPPLFLLHLF